jgi:hypothetical protein
LGLQSEEDFINAINNYSESCKIEGAKYSNFSDCTGSGRDKTEEDEE